MFLLFTNIWLYQLHNEKLRYVLIHLQYFQHKKELYKFETSLTYHLGMLENHYDF